MRARRNDNSGGVAVWIGAGALVLAGLGLWLAWRYVATPAEKPEEPTGLISDVEIPFDGIDQTAPDDRFVMTVEIESAKAGVLPEGLRERLEKCDAFARDSLATEYPEAKGRTPVVRLVFPLWPSEANWETLRSWVKPLTTVEVEAVGARGSPRTVEK